MRKTISILVDNVNSWIIPFANELNLKFMKAGHHSVLIYSASDVSPSDVMFILACEKIIAPEFLERNKHNIVIHESNLPQGKGWSPLTWQVLEGRNEIPFTLFEAAKDVDAGEIFMRESVKLQGHELNNELKRLQGEKTIEMCEKFLQNFSQLKGIPQAGESTFYPRRTPKDSELDIRKTIEEQFNLLRVCDNERYPAYFYNKNKKYIIKIYQEEN